MPTKYRNDLFLERERSGLVDRESKSILLEDYASTIILIQNARLPLHSDEILFADVLIKKGRISKISKSSLTKTRADKVINAGENFLLPGIIDTHTHMGDPAYPEREDFTSGTEAAVCGGVTTVLEMPSSIPPVSDRSAFSSRAKRIPGRAYANIGFYAGAGYENLSEVEPLSSLGAIAFKTYLQRPPLGREKEHFGMHAYKASQIRDTFRTVLETGKLLAIHAEDEKIVSDRSNYYMEEGKSDMKSILASRPVRAEIKAIERAIEIASLLGKEMKLEIAHVSSKQALDLLRRKKRIGKCKIYVEGRPDYLLFEKKDALKHEGFLKTYPPVRTKEDRAAIIEAVNDQTIDYFGSDHAPRTKEEKELPDLWRVPAGTPSIEIMLRVLLDLVSRKLIDIFSIVRMQQRAARAFNLSGRGTIELGAIADLVLVDMKSKVKLESDKFHTRSKDSAVIYDGLKLTGVPLVTIVGGKIVMEDGQIIPEAKGAGQFLNS